MSFGNDMDREIARLTKEQNDILLGAAQELYNAVVKASPVGESRPSREYKDGSGRMTQSYTGGELKASWQTPEKESDRVYTIKDIAPHAIIIDGGRRMVGNKMQGSEQLPDGYTPIVKQVEAKVNRRLR